MRGHVEEAKRRNRTSSILRLCPWAPCLLVLGLSQPAAAQVTDQETIDRRLMSRRFFAFESTFEDQRKRSFEEELACHEVAGATLVIIDQWRLGVRHYGIRNKYLGLPTDANTIYDAASLSKVVAGLAFAGADRQGVFDLDESLESFARRRPESVTARWRRKAFVGAKGMWPRTITGRLLLNHAGGVSRHGIGQFRDVALCNSIESIVIGGAFCEGMEARDAPGVSFAYSGGGYTVVEDMLQTSTGRSYAEFARVEVLDRVGMPKSTFAAGHAGMIDLARGCSRGNCNNRVQHMNVKAAGGLLAHPAEYARLIQLLMHGGREVLPGGDLGEAVLDASVVRQVLTPGWASMSSNAPCATPASTLSSTDGDCAALPPTLVRAAKPLIRAVSNPQVCFDSRCRRLLRTSVTGDRDKRYGLGINLSNDLLADGLPREFTHSGLQEGFRNNFWADRETGRAFVVFINGEGAWKGPGGAGCLVSATTPDTANRAGERGSQILEPRVSRAMKDVLRNSTS